MIVGIVALPLAIAFAIAGFFISALGGSCVQIGGPGRRLSSRQPLDEPARRGGSWRHGPTVHVTGMGASYIVLLTAFYVDHAQEPSDLAPPPNSRGILPSVVGLPLIAWALRTVASADTCAGTRANE